MLERVMAAQVDRTHLSRTEHAWPEPGILHASAADSGTVHGGWHGGRRTAVRRLLVASAVGAAAPAVAGARGRLPTG